MNAIATEKAGVAMEAEEEATEDFLANMINGAVVGEVGALEVEEVLVVDIATVEVEVAEQTFLLPVDQEVLVEDAAEEEEGLETISPKWAAPVEDLA